MKRIIGELPNEIQPAPLLDHSRVDCMRRNRWTACVGIRNCETAEDFVTGR